MSNLADRSSLLYKKLKYAAVLRGTLTPKAPKGGFNPAKSGTPVKQMTRGVSENPNMRMEEAVGGFNNSHNFASLHTTPMLPRSVTEGISKGPTLPGPVSQQATSAPSKPGVSK